MKTDLFDYALPKELIAYHPPEKRDGGRLLVLDPNTGAIKHRAIVDLPECLPKETLLVANDTRVIRARLRGRRPTGGEVEVLLIREIEAGQKRCTWSALTRANKPIKVGDRIDLGGIWVEVTEKRAQGEVTISVKTSSKTLREHTATRGEVPLPPYIRRLPVSEDDERYQTVYAKCDGSVAAPTAGLHFTEELLKRLSIRGLEIEYITLHVGPGTFRPISVEETSDHKMDSEEYLLNEKATRAIRTAKANARPVVAVGTTVTRALEGAFARHGGLETGSGFTDLFITPGFTFHVIDGMLTNFHLPRSTLLCLISALAGRERVLAAYEEAVKERYRFYSYGDAMLILPVKR
ncbi:MAG: tRNA preQ1(34) S-adenosylmethionine ribosyltransferase-isomerase QueA [Proteobacteria bacterium]|nr:tRNA preQ1(34) S-adenosylmethionine ribosyltransferase-isomerase QueA [Pseudomonadota bacterium]